MLLYPLIVRQREGGNVPVHTFSPSHRCCLASLMADRKLDRTESRIKRDYKKELYRLTTATRMVELCAIVLVAYYGRYKIRIKSLMNNEKLRRLR